MEQAEVEVIESLKVAQLIKEQAVRREGAGTDIPITLHLFREGVHLGVAELLYERAEALDMAVRIVALSEADEVIHVADSYAMEHPSEDLEYGDLAKAFKAGDPNVHESIHAVSIRADGTVAAVWIPYTYAGRTVIWGEHHDFSLNKVDEDEGIGGDWPQAIMAGYELQKERPGPPRKPEEIAVLLRCNFIVPIMRRPPRNEPCPCGSGRKAKLCCWA